MPKQIIDDHRLLNERQGSVTLLGSMVRYGSHDLPDPSGVAEHSLGTARISHPIGVAEHDLYR